MTIRNGLILLAVSSVSLALAAYSYNTGRARSLQVAQQEAENNAVAIKLREHPPSPTVTESQQASGTLISITVRAPIMEGSSLIAARHCYVWRDTPTRTTSMWCEPDTMPTSQ